jgi:hypothetical protein
MANDSLSPAAQSVRKAARKVWCQQEYPVRIVAAALRALADQVVPETATPWNSTLTPIISAKDVRSEILAIADELEGGNG